jgi:hypothetical protein
MITRTFVKDVVALEGTVFLVVGMNAFGMAIFLHNQGANQVTYRYQESNENVEGSFTDIATFSGNLNTNAVILHKITSTKPYVRLLAYAAGGSKLLCGISQYYLNVSSIQPIINI